MIPLSQILAMRFPVVQLGFLKTAYASFVHELLPRRLACLLFLHISFTVFFR